MGYRSISLYFYFICSYVVANGICQQNLGLGVLEEKRDDNETDTSEEDATSDTDVKGEEEEAKDSAAAVSRPPRPRESNILGKLMGNKTARKNKPAIEEIVD